MSTDGNWHPSFAPVVHRIRERGFKSPHASVGYECDGHDHGVMCGDHQISGFEEGQDIEVYMEEVGTELAENIRNCDEGRHKGLQGYHGRPHHPAHEQLAFRSAIQQLRTREYDREYAQKRWLEAGFRKWGGHVPGAVILPNELDPTTWQLLVPDQNADPVFYDIRKGVMDEILPSASPQVATKLPFGWRAKNWSGKRRLAHLDRKFGNSRN